MSDYLATLTYQVPADLIEAVGRAVTEVLKQGGSEPARSHKPEQPRSTRGPATSSPDLSCVQATAPLPSSASPEAGDTILAGPLNPGGPDGDRSKPSSSAGGAKMDRAESSAPGQSDVDASGTHYTQDEQAVPHSPERDSGSPDSAICNARDISGDSRPAARVPLENAATSPAGEPIKHGCQQPGSCRIKFKTDAICWQCRAAGSGARASA